MNKVIGRFDKADFPELDLENIDIKIDSGAYTSSIHCTHIEIVKENDEKFIQFQLLDQDHPQYHTKSFKTKNYTVKSVKSSNGIAEDRFVIQTKIVLFNETYKIYLTLSERSKMKYPVLIGRKFLNKKFIIDTTKKNISYKAKI